MDNSALAFAESDKFFPTDLQKFQFYDKYSRFNYDLGRRETWIETVNRAVDYLKKLSENKLSPRVYDDIFDAILNMRAMPSMRLLAMAGAAAERNNIAIYNCSYLPVDSLDSFVEALIISMNGCGVGYSVEYANVSKLPQVSTQTGETTDYIVEDTTEGWADALRFGLERWFDGKDVNFLLDLVRPAGSVLKVKGGRASGPEPLAKMFDKVRTIVLNRQGGKLTTLDAHDIMCHVGNAAVSGGTRRTAMIALFDYKDQLMLHCKDGDFDIENPQRWNANNSAVVPTHTMNQQEFVEFFMGMVQGGRGEPGIFSRQAAERMKPYRRESAEWGSNPCGEINLRPYGFCNLSIAVARSEDTLADLRQKVEIATIIGTIQAMATNFPGLRPIWEQNAKEERLLGVDITGQMDSPVARDPKVQKELRELAVETNKIYAEKLGIPQAAAVTCVKPSGNSSQLLNCSSGIHPRWSQYYIRNVRVGAATPVFKVLQESGFPMSPENGQTRENANTWVAHFVVSSPKGSLYREDTTAVEQANYWLQTKLNWTEHNPSVTINYRPNEILDLMMWVWDFRHYINGISFLPFSDAKYNQMPYEAIGKEAYEELLAKQPAINFGLLPQFETEDYTTASSELACVSGVCSMDDLVPSLTNA